MGDDVRVAIGVNHGNDGQTQLVGLSDRYVLLVRVNNEDGVRQLVEATDATQVPLQLLKLTGVAQGLLFRHRLEVAGLLHCLELLHTLHPGGDRLEVGEHPAEPALVDVGHTACIGVDSHRALGLLLGAHEEDSSATGDEVPDVGVGLLDTLHRLLEIDQVDPVALTDDESPHLGVPSTGLMPEVDTGAQQLLHADDGHVTAPCDG